MSEDNKHDGDSKQDTTCSCTDSANNSCQADSADNVQQLIADYEQSKKSATRASRCVAGFILLILTVNAVFLVMATRNFAYNRIPELWVAFGRGMEPATVRHMPQVNTMLRNLYPVYTKAFHDMAVNKYPELKTAINSELDKLEDYGRKKQPEIERELDTIAAAREKDFVSNLEQLLGREVSLEEQRRIVSLYRKVLRNKFYGIWSQVLEEHKAVVPEIEKSLNLLIRMEPELDRDVAPQEAIGILLEFLGVEMQAGEFA